MPAEMTQGAILEDFTFALYRMHLNSTGAYREALGGMYQSSPGENGDTILIVRSDIRALLFSEMSHEHLDNLLALMRGGITGTEALKAALAGEAPTTMVSGTL